MNKNMNKIINKLDEYRIFNERPLIDLNGGVYVMISHAELDDLIGSLMHLMDLNSDVQFREAMKSEIKIRTRQWLNDKYSSSGYEYGTYLSGAKVIGISEDYELVFDTAK